MSSQNGQEGEASLMTALTKMLRELPVAIVITKRGENKYTGIRKSAWVRAEFSHGTE